jgi:WD40 repeat protein
MTGVFISYSRKDSKVAQALMNEFKSMNLDVWVDWEDIPPAVGWLDQILRGIERADAFVFLISPDSINSEVCNVELAHAHKNSKRIIPIVIRDVNPKDTVSIIRDLNWIFLRETDDFAMGMKRVGVAVNLDIEWLHEHSRLHVRALDWDRRKDPSLLLRGGDLRHAFRMIAEHEASDPKPSDLQKMYIMFSRRNERVRTITWISAVLALLVMVMLSILAWDQRQAAVENAAEAQKQTNLAQQSESLAIENARAALAAKAAAVNNENIAKAQRSAARAQIFQSRTGGLFTSTLLAIDSYTRNPTSEAEGILRKNISLLPISVKEFQYDGSIRAIELSPDGTSFVAASEDGSICLIRFEDGESQYCWTSSGSVLDAAFNPAGTVLVTSDSNGEVNILSVEDGQELKQIKLGVSVRDVNISPDGNLLAMARDDSRISLIKLSNYEFAGEFSVFGSLRVTAFSPDGIWFAAGSNIGAITFWNLETGRIVTGSTHRGEIFDIEFSPDSRRLISGGADNYAIMTNPSTGREVLRVFNEDHVVDVLFSPDGSWFITASNDFRIRVWDSDSGEEQLRFLQDSLVNEVKVSPNGLWIASTGSDRTVRVWSAANGAEMFQIPLDHTGTELEFSADSTYLVTGDEGGYYSIWDLSALKSNIGYVRFTEFVNQMEISPQGDWIAASTGGQVWLLNPNLFATQTTPPKSPTIDFGTDDVYDLTISPDGTTLAISTTEGRIILLNKATGATRNLVASGPAKKMIFSSDSNTLYFAGQDTSLQYRSLNSSDAGILWQSTSVIYSLAISSADVIAVGLENKVILLGADMGALGEALNAPGINRKLAFNIDGTMLTASTDSGRTYVWQIQDGQFEIAADFVSAPAYSVSFELQGNRLFLGEADQTLIFDPLTGAEINRIRQKGALSDIVFAPDEATLFTASLRTIQIFDLSAIQNIDGDEIITVACSRVTQNFGAAEWLFFFADEEYRVLCEDLPIP